MRTIHLRHLVQNAEQLVIPVAVLQVKTHVLHISARQVNSASFGGD